MHFYFYFGKNRVVSPEKQKMKTIWTYIDIENLAVHFKSQCELFKEI